MRLNQGILVGFLLISQTLFAATPNQLTVLSASPKGQQGAMERQAVSVHFNQAVAALGEESQFSSDKCPLQISPKIEGTCRYSGTQTLLFEPTENWPAATRFTVTLKAGFTSAVSKKKLAKDYSFSFTTQVPQVLQVIPYSGEHWISLNPTIFVLFNMPVDLNALSQYAVFSANDQTISVTARSMTEEEHKKTLSYSELKNIAVLSPVQSLQKDSHYTLELRAGLPAATGNAGMSGEFRTDFYTEPNLEILNHQTTGCLPFTPSIDLSSPVRLRELARSMEVIPSSAKRELTLEEENFLGNEHNNSKKGEAFFRVPLSFIKVEPHQTVKVTLKAGMQDIYNNRLEKDYSFTISAEGYCPAVDFSGGRGVLESYLKPFLPIDVMNVISLPLRGTRFNKENFIPFDQSSVPYCKEAPLKDVVFEGDYTFTDVKDKTLKTYLNLEKFNPTSKDSIIFSQVQIKRGKNEPCWISSTDNITDIGITFKTSAENILLWITSLQTGKPLENREVELRSKDNKVLWKGSSDVNGLVRAPGWSKLDVEPSQWGQVPLYAFVTSPQGDGVVSNLWNDGMELWRFNIDYSYNSQENSQRSFLFTDRGIYRPGETVYLKGIWRQLEGGLLRIPEGTLRGKLVVFDARGNEVVQKEITLSSDYGSFDTSFNISPSAYTGYWNASFIPLVKDKPMEDNTTSASFQVEAVTAASFKVNIRSLSQNYLSGEEANFITSAQYQFGAPLSGAAVKWTLRQSPTYFKPKGYEKYNFSPYFVREDMENASNKLLASSSNELDKNGSFEFSAKMPQETYPVSVFAEANVQSPARQDLFSRTSVTVHPASFYLGAKIEQENPTASTPVSVHVIAVTPDGKPTQSTVVAEIYKEQWFSVRKTSLAGRLEWVSEKQTIPLPTQVLEVGKKGKTFSFVPPEGGSYYIKLTASDEFGHKVVGGESVYVYGKEGAYWRQRDDDLLTLKQNKNEYKVGQTARVRVESPYEKATALVTVEREGILDAWTTEIKGGASYVPIKIKENYLPNVYVSVLLAQGRTDKPVTEKLDLGKPQVKIGYVNLDVIPSGNQIETSVKTDKPHYSPGDTVTLDITTKVQGKATPAEVTVMAVDGGILDLTHYKTPDLFRYFYGARPLSVFTMDNRSYLIGQRSFGEKGENRGGGGSGADTLGGTDLRSNFKFTPYFNAHAKTDAQGKAHLSFTLPDNLTQFRIMAVSVKEQQFGKAETSIRVSKPLMVTANLPRFARKGDHFKCGAVVYNYEDKKGVLTLQAKTDGAVELNGKPVQEITLPLGNSKEFTWDCTATKEGEGTIAFSVNGDKNSDGVQQKITVSSVEKPQTLASYGATQSTQEELLNRPTSLASDAHNTVNLSLSSTALLQLSGALDYLMTYPYDCLEQQFSKIVPVITGAPVLEAFHLSTRSSNRSLVQKILDNLPLYQYPTGGFSYWKGGRPDPYVTAYVLEVSTLAKAQGYSVPSEALKKAVEYLAVAFDKRTQRAYTYTSYETETAQAYLAYVLSLYGKNIEGTFNTLYAKRTTLSVAAQAYLLKTAAQIKRPQEQQEALAQQLRNRFVYNPSSVYVDNGPQMTYLHLDNVSATALVLDAFIQSGQPLDSAYQMVTWLVGQINAKGYWKNTSVNAQVVRSLLSYYQKYEAQTPDFTADVTQQDTSLLTHDFKGRTTQAVNKKIDFSNVYGTDGQARLKFTKQGTGTLYYSVGQTYMPSSYQRPVNSGFRITRKITGLDDKPVEKMLAGERYKITLTITSSAVRNFVAAEDFIPAGFELVNSSLATESTEGIEEKEPSAFTRSEQYDDRIVAFADYLPSGTHTFSYVVSARVRGTFAYPAAWVSQMYEPEVFGRNATTNVVIE